MVTYHQCSGCSTIVKGQRGISRHCQTCVLSSNTFISIIETSLPPYELNRLNAHSWRTTTNLSIRSVDDPLYGLPPTTSQDVTNDHNDHEGTTDVLPQLKIHN